MTAEKYERKIQVKKINISLTLNTIPEYYEPHSMRLHVNLSLSLSHTHTRVCAHARRDRVSKRQKCSGHNTALQSTYSDTTHRKQ